MTTLSADQYLAKVKQQNKARAKKFYDLNKERISLERKARYALKNKKTNVDDDKPYQHNGDIPEIDEQPIQMVNEHVVQPVSQSAVKSVATAQQSIVARRKTNLDLTYLINFMKTYLKEHNDVKPNTIKTYISDIKRIMRVTKCDHFEECLKHPKKIIKSITEGTQKNGKDYKNNTLKNTFQVILWIIDQLHLPIDKKPFDNTFGITKIQSKMDTDHRVATEIIMPFNTYIEKCKDTFGLDSMMYLLAKMYKELTVRDDFVLKIVQREADMTNDKDSYLIARSNGSYTIIINEYKTDKRYGVIKYSCSIPLTKLIKKYMTTNKKTIGDYLFENHKNTAYISTNNKLIDATEGTNYYRRMMVTDTLKNMKFATPEKRKELSDKMYHSPVSQLVYMRQHEFL